MQPHRFLSSRPARLGLLLLIVWLAFSLRVYRLDAQEIWGDESVSISARRLSAAQVLLGKTDVHPPLYFFVLREAMLPFGTSVFAIRFVSTFWGTLIVSLVYRVGRRAIGGRAGVLAALVAAASALQVLYSQEARMYTMATAWAAASLWCTVELLRGDENRAGRAWWGAFVVTSLVGMYTHYFVAFVVLGEGLALLWAARRRRGLLSRLAVATAVVALVYAPWIPIQRQYAASQAYTRWNLLTPAVLADVARQTLISWSVAAFNVKPGQMFPGASWGTVVVALFAVLGVLAVVRARRIQATLVPLCAAAVIVLGWAINPILPVFQDRYLMVGAPAYLILVGAGLDWLLRFKPRLSPVLAIAGIAAVLAPQVVALRAWFGDPTFVKGEYGKAMGFISSRAQPGDVLLLNNYNQWGLFDYYRPANVPAELVPAEALSGDATTGQAMDRLVAGRSRAWLVEFGYAAQYDPDHRAEHWLAGHGYKQLAQDFIGLRANLYVLGSQAGESAPAHRLDARMGNSIALTGYTLDSDRAQPGESLRLTLYWQATGPVSVRYTVFTHLVNSAGKPVAQTDSPPQGGTAPTDGWQPGVLVVDRYAIAVPGDTPPGTYELRVGMYPWPDLKRLPVTLSGQPAGDYLPLATVQITP